MVTTRRLAPDRATFTKVAVLALVAVAFVGTLAAGSTAGVLPLLLMLVAIEIVLGLTGRLARTGVFLWLGVVLAVLGIGVFFAS
ncbi:MAG: hypothetical protein AAF467_04790 [Actinomycetota bacterium]